MRIRAAQAADIGAMHVLRLRVTENRLADPTQVTEASHMAYLGQGGAWVAETERGLAGFAILDLAKCEIWALFVAPEAQGTGIGRALHARMLGGALDHGLRRLSLATEPGTRAERFYAEAGWVEAGITAAGEPRLERILIG